MRVTSCELRVENVRVASVNLRVEICELVFASCEFPTFASCRVLHTIVFHANDPTLLTVPDMIHSIIPPIFFKHTAILVPKVESYFSYVPGEIWCENSM